MGNAHPHQHEPIVNHYDPIDEELAETLVDSGDDDLDKTDLILLACHFPKGNQVCCDATTSTLRAFIRLNLYTSASPDDILEALRNDNIE